MIRIFYLDGFRMNAVLATYKGMENTMTFEYINIDPRRLRFKDGHSAIEKLEFLKSESLIFNVLSWYLDGYLHDINRKFDGMHAIHRELMNIKTDAANRYWVRIAKELFTHYCTKSLGMSEHEFRKALTTIFSQPELEE